MVCLLVDHSGPGATLFRSLAEEGMKSRKQVGILESWAHSWKTTLSSYKLSQMVKPSCKFKPKHRSKTNKQTNRKRHLAAATSIWQQRGCRRMRIEGTYCNLSQAVQKLLSMPLSAWTSLTTLSRNLHAALLHSTEEEEGSVLTALLNSPKAAQLLNIGPDDTRHWFCG